MIKCVFLDFFGTLVEEDDYYISKIVQRIHSTAEVSSSTSEISEYWYNCFLEIGKSQNKHNFISQRQMEIESLTLVVENFKSNEKPNELVDILLSYWSNPQPFKDAMQFLHNCPFSKCIVSNIDNQEIQMALKKLDLQDVNVITSEDAQSYKPNKEIFQMALDKCGLNKEEVIHIGDSYSMDVIGSYEMGIKNIWLNRKKRKTDLQKHDYVAYSFKDIEGVLAKEI